MFWTGIHTLTLNSFHIRSSHFPCQIWIFRKVFKISAAKGTPFHIQSRPQNNVYFLGSRFFTERNTDFFSQLLIPTVGNGCRRRETGCFKRSIQSQMIPCSCLLTDTVRTVRTENRRNIQSRKISCLPYIFTAQKGGFFFQCHLIDQILMFQFRFSCITMWELLSSLYMEVESGGFPIPDTS